MADRYSVVIPAFDAAATIGDALQSIAAQTVAPAQVIVVDDGSTDDTAGRARAFADQLDLVVIRQANAGCGAATNVGIDLVATPSSPSSMPTTSGLPTRPSGSSPSSRRVRTLQASAGSAGRSVAPSRHPRSGR